jgi:hypothetical protein
MAEIESLKNLTRDQLSDMLYAFFESIKATITKDANNIFTAMVEVNGRKIDEVLTQTSISASNYMNSYIETVIGENSSEYNRNLVLFESEPSNTLIFFRWFK